MLQFIEKLTIHSETKAYLKRFDVISFQAVNMELNTATQQQNQKIISFTVTCDNMQDARTLEKRKQEAERKHKCKQMQSEHDIIEQRCKHAESQRKYKKAKTQGESMHESQKRKAENATTKRKAYANNKNKNTYITIQILSTFVESSVITHDIGHMNYLCCK